MNIPVSLYAKRYDQLIDERDALAAKLRNVEAERDALKEKVDELECTIGDEEAAHADTIRLWENVKADRDRLCEACKRAIDHERLFPNSLPVGIAVVLETAVRQSDVLAAQSRADDAARAWMVRRRRARSR